MGGYAFFVWTAYAITLLIMVANVWLARRNQRRIGQRIQRQLRFERRPSP